MTWIVLIVTLGAVIGGIAWLRLPPYLILMLAALTGELLLVGSREGASGFTGGIARVTGDSGVVAGKLGLSIALAAVIGAALTKSGAADRITAALIRSFGERWAAGALLLSGFFLSVPIFVDTVLLLLLPIARALAVRTGRGGLLYLLAVGIGATIANGTVPPAPGPLYMTEALKLNMGAVILAATACGVLPALAAMWFARTLEQRRVPATASGDATAPTGAVGPGLVAALAPLVIPLGLIAAASFAHLPLMQGRVDASLGRTLQVLGDKNIALAIGAILAVIVDVRQRQLRGTAIGGSLAKPLEAAGVIILLIAAGGAYGKMIERAGLGAAVQQITGPQLNIILLGWAVAALMRVAQGSATVAVITAVGVVNSLEANAAVHAFYVLLGIGYGSKFMPWMNDAGFWLFCRLGGLTPGETLRGWTMASSAVALAGLAQVWVLARLWPNPPF